MQDKFKNILIIKPSSLGDIVQTLPALSALRRSFPDAEISWLVRPEFAPLLDNHPDLTRIIPFDRRYLAKMWYHPGALIAFLGLCRRLRRSKFDAVFDFQGLFRTAFLARVSGCRNRFGLANAREFGALLYTHKVSQPPDCIHVVDCYIRVVQAAGVSDLDVEFTLPSDPAADDTVAALLAEHDVNANNYAVLVPGSTHPDKCWPVERFAALADMLAHKHNLSIVATGTESEAQQVRSLAEAADVPVANFAGRMSITELIALMASARLVVSNDTGPGYVAAALGTPIVMIFGRTNPARLAPYGRKNVVAGIDIFTRGREVDSQDPKYAIKNVTLDLVYQKVLAQLKPHT